MSSGRPIKVRKGASAYPVRSFYYPIDIDYLKVWEYFVSTYPNKASIIRRILFRFLFEEINNVDKGKRDDEQKEIRETIKILIGKESIKKQYG